MTRAQADQLGVDRRALPRLVRSGVLRRERRGLYRVLEVATAQSARLKAATLSTGGVISHAHAARLWNDGGPLPDPVEVTVAGSRRPRSTAAVIVHRSRTLERRDVALKDGTPVTAPPRTLLDLAAPGYGWEDTQLLAVIAQLLGSRVVSIPVMERYLQVGRRAVPGVHRLRGLFAELAGGKVDSAAEQELLGLIVAAGLPVPHTQHEIRDGRRLLARVDLAWPVPKVALELDGYRYHADPRTFVADRERGNRIVLAGWTLLRTTPASMRQSPDELTSILAAALHAAGRGEAPGH